MKETKSQRGGDSMINERELRQIFDEFYEPEDPLFSEEDFISKVNRLSDAAFSLGNLIKKHPDIYEDAKELAALLCSEDYE